MWNNVNNINTNNKRPTWYNNVLIKNEINYPLQIT